MAISFFSMLKSLMILKRSGNGNSSSYKEKMYLMQQWMLLPATNTSLVKTASQWHFKERDRKQVFSVVQLPFHFRGMARYWQLLSFFPFSWLYYFLLLNVWVCTHVSLHMTSYDLITLFLSHIWPSCIFFLKKNKTYFLVPNIRIMCSLKKFWKIQGMCKERKSIHIHTIQYTY